MKQKAFTLIELRTTRGTGQSSSENKGFTLVELLIVIGIIAVLATAVIIAINPGRQFAQARNSTRQSHINSALNAVLSYQAGDMGKFPNFIPSYPGAVDLLSCEEDLSEFISSIPTDPRQGSYHISYSGINQENINTISDADEYFSCGNYFFYENQLYPTVEIGDSC